MWILPSQLTYNKTGWNGLPTLTEFLQSRPMLASHSNDISQVLWDGWNLVLGAASLRGPWRHPPLC